MRGKLILLQYQKLTFGITPACAGKTPCLCEAAPHNEDHPRMCGENDVRFLPVVACEGSPPHVRGKPVVVQGFHSVVGITPACAGKTLYVGRPRSDSRDHPRMCGENPLRFVLADTHKGSPPHVRGKLRLLLALSNPLGITPACAGKTRNLPLKRRQRRDHPRMCGENNKQSRFWALLRGSPPHVRGKQLEKANETKRYRITPACAGKTFLLLVEKLHM